MTGTTPTPELSSRIQADPDLVDRIFEYIFSDPSMAQALQTMAGGGAKKVGQLKTAVRAEFGGEECYISGKPGRATAQNVLALFDGRNATEVARVLGISRATVYRSIKQPGGRNK